MKKLLSAVLVLVMTLTIIPLGAVTASAETTSGTTGDCTWTLVDGVLTISGNGEMGDYFNDSYDTTGNILTYQSHLCFKETPWDKNVIEQVIILDGVTDIGEIAFMDCNNLKRVEISDTVEIIRRGAFYNCPNLTTVLLSNNVKQICDEAFTIDYWEFEDYEKLEIYYQGTEEEKNAIVMNGYNYVFKPGEDFTLWYYDICKKHTYTNLCEEVCDSCGFVNEDAHVYDNRFDLICNICENSRPQETLKKEDGKWYYYNYNERSYDTTLVKFKGKWFYVENGVWETEAYTIIKYKGKWFGVVDGKWNSSVNTLVAYKCNWFYIKNGKWDSSAETLTKYNGKWFYIKNGKWDKTATKFFKYNGKTFYIKNGKWDSSITSLIAYKDKMRYVKNGKWNKSKAIVRYKPKYVEIIDGVYIASSELKGYKGERYYVNNGYVQSNFSGRVKVDGKTYKIKNGKVV